MSIHIVLLTISSCKIYENKKRDRQKVAELQWQNLEQRQRLYTFRQDTLSRSWYFWTDTVFRFHADSGLFAQSGRLLGHQSTGSTSRHMQNLTRKNEQGKLKETERERSSKKQPFATKLWLVGVVLVLLFLWRWSRTRRFL
ncbi:hypothetical protein [Sphingobacterium sp. CZ-UAM]|uniref:hypothetical protein n=1 Tax=Sphingobacterium sp. CZ-UAM TaxID=1933868 RepID=UPI00111555C6|nr:hypothetical protein [Sphingobacterium sp. CZ-UAM]